MGTSGVALTVDILSILMRQKVVPILNVYDGSSALTYPVHELLRYDACVFLQHINRTVTNLARGGYSPEKQSVGLSVSKL